MSRQNPNSPTLRAGYRDIAARMRDDIQSGRIPAGLYLPTERELQEKFNASRSTIRKSLALLVEEGFGQSVPNRGVIATQGNRPAKTKKIAIIDKGSYVVRVLTARLSEVLQSKGYEPVHMGGRMDYPLEYALQRAVDNDFAGAIVWSYKAFADLDFLINAADRMPVVAMDHSMEGAETDLVTFNHQRAAYEATEQLIRQGCKRIAVTGMLDMLDVTHQRFSGYMRALFENGFQPYARDFVFTATSNQEVVDPFPLETRLRAADRPDGMLVLQELFVPGTIEAALRCGLSLPHDLKIASICDDIDVDVDGAGLTAIAFDWNAMAEAAVELLEARISDPSRPFQTRVLPHRLTVRGLCGAPASEWTSDADRIDYFRGEPSLTRSRFHYSSRWSVQGDGSNLTVEVSNHEKSLHSH